MIYGNRSFTGISIEEAVKSKLFDAKLALFNKLNPDIQCSDWMYKDSGWDVDDNLWELYFIQWEKPKRV